MAVATLFGLRRLLRPRAGDTNCLFLSAAHCLVIIVRTGGNMMANLMFEVVRLHKRDMVLVDSVGKNVTGLLVGENGRGG